MIHDTFYREIFVPILFLPLMTPSSVGTFRIGQFFVFITLEQNTILRLSEIVCMCERAIKKKHIAKITM